MIWEKSLPNFCKNMVYSEATRKESFYITGKELNLQQNLRNISTGNLKHLAALPCETQKLGLLPVVLRFHYRFGFRFGFAQKTEVSVFPVSVFT